MRDKEPCWAAVFESEVLAVEAKGDPSLLVLEIAEGQVRGVVAVGMCHDEGCLRSEPNEQCVERNAFPGGAEFRPSRDTVQVDGRAFGWQLPERFPVPSPQQSIALVPDREFLAIE